MEGRTPPRSPRLGEMRSPRGDSSASQTSSRGGSNRELPPLPPRSSRTPSPAGSARSSAEPRSSGKASPRSPTPPPRRDRRDDDVVIHKSPRNWRVSDVEPEVPDRLQRRTKTETPDPIPQPTSPRKFATLGRPLGSLPPPRQRRGTQYRAASTDHSEPRPAARQIELSEQSRQRVKACKHFMYEYYLGWFKYLNQRKARVDKVEKEMRLMPGDSGQAHRVEHFKKESQYLRQRRRKMRLGEFQILALLGKGAFGAVYLSRKRDTGEVLAVKKITKAQFDASNKDRVLREKKVLAVASSNPWLVGLSYAFQDKDFLYLAMEYIPGGDLRGLLKNVGCLDETMATFYLVEMIASVAALHKLGFVHRDLKPDNFLISQTGHLRLADFGLSKDGLELNYRETLSSMRGALRMPKEIDFRTKLESYRKELDTEKKVSVVGSPDYMAVEILRGSQYNYSVDWWSIGVIFYEMMAGLPPFYAHSPMEIFSNIMEFKKTLQFPELTTGEEEEGEEEEPCMSQEAWNVIRHFIQEPNRRLGRDGFEQIKQHRFFADVNWDHLLEEEAPFVPELEGEADCSYFLGDEEQELDESEFTSDDTGGNLQKDANFIGFTFKNFQAPAKK